MTSSLRPLLCAAALLVTTSVASAIVINDPAGTFGSLPGATFGGSGIPTDAVMINTFNYGTSSITLGLTAHQRYSNPAPENDGNGNFWAKAGGDAANGQPGYALWNVGYYSSVNPLAVGSGYSLRLYYDLNPAEGNDVSTTANWFLSNQNSWNLGMSGMFSPFPGSFDPSATGEYAFALVLFQGDTEIGRSAIIVNVNDTGTRPAPVPEGGATVALLGLAVTGMGVIARRRRA